MTKEEQNIWKLLNNVHDPEVPVLSVVDLGIIRDIKMDHENIEIVLTPTYTGCPAMNTISANIKMELLANGFSNIKIISVLSPAWTTDWITEEGKRKLKAYGIAPPNPKQQVCREYLFAEEIVQCPYCNSYHTHRISEFGSTACKALYQCDDCREPFDYFKCH